MFLVLANSCYQTAKEHDLKENGTIEGIRLKIEMRKNKEDTKIVTLKVKRSVELV